METLGFFFSVDTPPSSAPVPLAMKRLRSSMGLGSVPLSRLMVPRSFLRVASPSFTGLGRGAVYFSEAATANVEASSLPSNVQLDTATQAYLKKEALLEQCEC